MFFRSQGEPRAKRVGAFIHKNQGFVPNQSKTTDCTLCDHLAFTRNCQFLKPPSHKPIQSTNRNVTRQSAEVSCCKDNSNRAGASAGAPVLMFTEVTRKFPPKTLRFHLAPFEIVQTRQNWKESHAGVPDFSTYPFPQEPHGVSLMALGRLSGHVPEQAGHVKG